MAQHGDSKYGGPAQPPDEGDSLTTETFDLLNVTKIPKPEVEPDTKAGLDEWGGIVASHRQSNIVEHKRADVDVP